jgi:hypothetical protein
VDLFKEGVNPGLFCLIRGKATRLGLFLLRGDTWVGLFSEG